MLLKTDLGLAYLAGLGPSVPLDVLVYKKLMSHKSTFSGLEKWVAGLCPHSTHSCLVSF
jgi:hypothetical protein